MEVELLRALTQLALDHGFDIDSDFAEPSEMTALIRDFLAFTPNQPIDDAHRRALLQNICLVIRRTCTSGHLKSIRQQSTLHRFRFLRQAMPEAADAYAAILGYLGVEVPDYLQDE